MVITVVLANEISYRTEKSIGKLCAKSIVNSVKRMFLHTMYRVAVILPPHTISNRVDTWLSCRYIFRCNTSKPEHCGTCRICDSWMFAMLFEQLAI